MERKGTRERERDGGVGWSPLLRALRVRLFVTLAECAVTVIWQTKAATTGLQQRRLLQTAAVYASLSHPEPSA